MNKQFVQRLLQQWLPLKNANRPKRVTGNLGDLEFEVISFETHYCYRVEHSRKYMETRLPGMCQHPQGLMAVSQS
jgi:hypothetical protein